MKDPKIRLLAAVFCVTAALTAPAYAHIFRDAGIKHNAALAATPVVVLGSDDRLGPEEFAAAHKIEVDELRRSHAASGLVECGDAHGAGQLTLANDVITTAAHVLFDEEGEQRAKTCDFIAEIDGRQTRIPVDMTSIVAGAARPYSVKAVHDWAVAKLTHPLDGASPYELAADVAVNSSVKFVARGHSDWGGGRRMSFEDCRLRAQTNQVKNGSREFAFDCTTGDGASGGAVLLGGQHRRLGAILVGWRSSNPSKSEPFSPTHYNFVVSVEGAFRRAVLSAAKKRPNMPAGVLTASATPETGVEKRNRHRSSAPAEPAPDQLTGHESGGTANSGYEVSASPRGSDMGSRRRRLRARID